MTSMSPFERVRARASALEMLGVGPRASEDEIRNAWRVRVSEHHAKRNRGQEAEFEKAKAAYEFLQNGGPVPEAAEETPVPSQPTPTRVRTPPRPERPSRPVSHIQDMEIDVVTACRNALSRHSATHADMGAANANATKDPGHAAERELTAKDHVPISVSRTGRSVTFLISDPLHKGINRVALPTNVVERNRSTAPKVMSFFSHDEGAGVVPVPDHVAQSLFPGARSVRIRFVGGQIERPITALQTG